MWLASISKHALNGRLIATGDWGAGRMIEGERLLRQALEGVGDAARERLFRMNVTLCLHRALTDAEIAALPESPPSVAHGLAGGPVEVLYTKGFEPSVSSLPCYRPHRKVLDPDRPDLWFPIDCGECPPCRDRRRLEVEDRGTIRRRGDSRASAGIGRASTSTGRGERIR